LVSIQTVTFLCSLYHTCYYSSLSNHVLLEQLHKRNEIISQNEIMIEYLKNSEK